MIPVVGPFLLLGIVAWVVAIGLGVGAWMGLVEWRRHWAVTGAMAGFGTFELYLHAHGALPLLVADAGLAFPAAAGLFVGCGVAAAYGTLFVPGQPARPPLTEGTAEETLWLYDAVDRLRPAPGDWLLSAALTIPAGCMLWVGTELAPGTDLVLTGVAGLLGPLFGIGGLLARRRTSDGLLEEIEAREAGRGLVSRNAEEART